MVKGFNLTSLSILQPPNIYHSHCITYLQFMCMCFHLKVKKIPNMWVFHCIFLFLRLRNDLDTLLNPNTGDKKIIIG